MTRIELEDFIQSYDETFTVKDLVNFFNIDNVICDDDDEIYLSCLQHYANQLEHNKDYSFKEMCKILEFPIMLK